MLSIVKLLSFEKGGRSRDYCLLKRMPLYFKHTQSFGDSGGLRFRTALLIDSSLFNNIPRRHA